MLSGCQIEALVDTSILKKNSPKSELVWRRYDRYKIENTKIKRSNQKPTRVNRVIDDIIRATKPAEPSRQVSQAVQAKPPPHHRHLIHSLLATCATSAPCQRISLLISCPLSRPESEMHAPDGSPWMERVRCTRGLKCVKPDQISISPNFPFKTPLSPLMPH